MRNKATATAQSVLMQRNQGHKESYADCISNNRQIDGNFCNLRMLISMLKLKERCGGYKLFYVNNILIRALMVNELINY